MLVELEELVEKQDSLVCEGYLTWFRVTSTSYDRCLARCVVDDAKWSLSDERHIFR